VEQWSNNGAKQHNGNKIIGRKSAKNDEIFKRAFIIFGNNIDPFKTLRDVHNIRTYHKPPLKSGWQSN
jgi:hypothetical protein